MSWVAVATVAVGAVSAGVSANSANKRAKNATNAYGGVIDYARQNPGAFGEKLDWESVEFNPIYRQDAGYGNIAGQTIAGNQRNLAASTQLARDTNAAVTQMDRDRINTLDPTFQASYDQQAQNTLNFLRGDLPQEDRNMITSRRTEAQSLGGGGVNGQQVAADLGLARLDLMGRGQTALTNNANLWNMISPLSGYIRPQSNFVDVQQAINSSIAENQFASQFAQSERNAELAWGLQGDPQQAGMLNLMAGQAGVQAANPTANAWGAALTGGVTSGLNYYAGQAKQNQAAQQSPYAPQQQAYTPPVQYFNSQADQNAGIGSLSNTQTPYANPYAGTAYNPSTGTAYGEQGGLWSYFNNNRRN